MNPMESNFSVYVSSHNDPAFLVPYAQRFNLATQRSRVVEAVERMQKAFADLQ